MFIKRNEKTQIMVVWIVVLVMVLLLALKPKDVKLFTFVFIVLYLLAAMRNPEIGQADTKSVYLPAFNWMQGQTLDRVIEDHIEKDLFFYICTYFIRFITSEEQLYLAICALPFFVPTYMLIRKFSCNYAVSIASFIAFNFYAQSFTTIRHTIALGFVTFAYYYFKENDNKKTMINFAIAPLFHVSAISAAVVYFTNRIPYKIKYYFLALTIGLLGSIVFVNVLRSSLVGELFMSFSRFEEYDLLRMQKENLGFALAIIVNLLMFFCINYYKQNEKYNTKYLESINMDYWMLTIGAFSSFMLVIMGEFLRITSFFIIPFMILLPQIFKEKKKSIIFVLIALGYFYFRQSVHAEIFEYKFYFE